MNQKNHNFYLTTTLPYVNASPHIGFALELIQADVIARWRRAQGETVFFNMGSDEHGVKIYRKAREQGIDPKTYCDSYAKQFANLKQTLNISWDYFVRTTDEHHIGAAQEFWRRCQQTGDIYKKNYQIKYCVGCELEKTESELENGKCPLHPNLAIEIIEEENYFFRYSNYQKKLLDFYESHPDFVAPQSRFNEIIAFTKRGLEDFSISRLKEKMPWGVAVPNNPDHVMYVWFDALVGYISALGWPENEKQFGDFWPGLQFAGKDNLRQQSSMWQAMLMSAGLPNSRQIFIHGFVTANGQKMSKSLGNVVDPFALVEKYGTDAVRYYLLREFSPAQDSDFTYEKFEQRYNADLAGGIGNLLSRTLALSQLMQAQEIDEKIQEAIQGAQHNTAKCLERFAFNESLESIWDLITICDRYLNEQKPWEKKGNAPRAISSITDALKAIGDLLTPFLPHAAERIKNAITQKKAGALFPRLTGKD